MEKGLEERKQYTRVPREFGEYLERWDYVVNITCLFIVAFCPRNPRWWKYHAEKCLDKFDKGVF
jgi:hypothetical protein